MGTLLLVKWDEDVCGQRLWDLPRVYNPGNLAPSHVPAVFQGLHKVFLVALRVSLGAQRLLWTPWVVVTGNLAKLRQGPVHTVLCVGLLPAQFLLFPEMIRQEILHFCFLKRSSTVLLCKSK